MNERIRFINATFGVVTGRCEVLCECGSPDCIRPVEVPSTVYDEIGAGVFLVTPGHEQPREQILSAGGSYCLVAPAA